MKARLPIPKKMKDQVYKFALEEIERQQKGATRRMMKLSVLAIRRIYGFGFKKTSKYIQEVQKLVEESENDEVFWYHNDKALDQLGFEFEHEDYEKWDR